MDNMTKYNIPFSPPDISNSEIDNVINVLKSGWITSGPKVKEFEDNICSYIGCDSAVAVASATAGMELILKILDIKTGDEIITTPYTYTSTSNIILHRGIKPTFVDTDKDSFLISSKNIEKAITSKTKAIYIVDFAGIPVDYDGIKDMLKKINREDIFLVSDSAHAFGAKYKGDIVGTQCDFHVFSFHAVKNLTTAEGGVITYNNNNKKLKLKEDLYTYLKISSLNGQTKDALSKTKPGCWQYDIITDGFKCNMTDIQAAIGIAQLERYDEMVRYRKQIHKLYDSILCKEDFTILPFSKDSEKETSYHVYPLRVKDFDEIKRDLLITKLASLGISTNVHFIPLPMFTLYKNLGYDIKNYPNTYAQYENEISLPLYSLLSLEDARIIAEEIVNCIKEILN